MTDRKLSKNIAMPTESAAELLRLRYFDGRYLRAEDMAREQDYFRRMIHLGHRSDGPGVVFGLTVQVDTKNGWLTVGPGLAVDPTGQILWLPTGFPAVGESLSVSDLVSATASSDGDTKTDAAAKDGRGEEEPAAGTRSSFGSCVATALDKLSIEIDPADQGPWIVSLSSVTVKCGAEAVYGRPCTAPCEGGVETSYLVDTVAVHVRRLSLGWSAEDIGEAEYRNKLASFLFEAERAASPSFVSWFGLTGEQRSSASRPSVLVSSGDAAGSSKSEPAWAPIGAQSISFLNIPASEIPLAIVYREPDNSWRTDCWMVRRELMEAAAAQYWATRTLQRPLAIFQAQINQFQSQLKEILQQRISEKRNEPSRASGWQPDDRIDSHGIVELPPAGYLPVKLPPAGQSLRTVGISNSVDAQITNLLGDSVNLTFFNVRADYIPEVVREAQHMERIELGQRADVSQRENVEIFVPDGNYIEEKGLLYGSGLIFDRENATKITPTIGGKPKELPIQWGAGRKDFGGEGPLGLGYYIAGIYKKDAAPRTPTDRALYGRIDMPKDPFDVARANLRDRIPFSMRVSFADYTLNPEFLIDITIEGHFSSVGPLKPVSGKTDEERISGLVELAATVFIVRRDTATGKRTEQPYVVWMKRQVHLKSRTGVETGKYSFRDIWIDAIDPFERLSGLPTALQDLVRKYVLRLKFRSTQSYSDGKNVYPARYFLGDALGNKASIFIPKDPKAIPRDSDVTEADIDTNSWYLALSSILVEDQSVLDPADANHKNAELALSNLGIELGAEFVTEERRRLWTSQLGTQALQVILPTKNWVAFRRARTITPPLDLRTDAVRDRRYAVYVVDLETLPNPPRLDPVSIAAYLDGLVKGDLNAMLKSAPLRSVLSFSPSLPTSPTSLTQLKEALKNTTAPLAFALIAARQETEDHLLFDQLRINLLAKTLQGQTEDDRILRTDAARLLASKHDSQSSFILSHESNGSDGYILLVTARVTTLHLRRMAPPTNEGWDALAKVDKAKSFDSLATIVGTPALFNQPGTQIDFWGVNGEFLSEKAKEKFDGYVVRLKDEETSQGYYRREYFWFYLKDKISGTRRSWVDKMLAKIKDSFPPIKDYPGDRLSDLPVEFPLDGQNDEASILQGQADGEQVLYLVAARLRARIVDQKSVVSMTGSMAVLKEYCLRLNTGKPLVGEEMKLSTLFTERAKGFDLAMAPLEYKSMTIWCRVLGAVTAGIELWNELANVLSSITNSSGKPLLAKPPAADVRDLQPAVTAEFAPPNSFIDFYVVLT